MTREDKIEQLENLKCHCYDMARVEDSNNEWMKDIEALDFAIATLEQELCEDCISRQAVIEYIKDCDAELMHDIENESVRDDILDMPSVTPKIPTSDDCVSRQAVIDKKELIELPDGQSFYSIDPEDIINMPPVTPKQEPKADVLDKIKAEIAEIEINGHIRDVECFNEGINVALNVIDKYRAESEEK